MSDANSPIGILIISHGSPRAEANQGFVGMVGRVASRLGASHIGDCGLGIGDGGLGGIRHPPSAIRHPLHVLPAFFSIARPDIPDQVAVLTSQGVRRIVLLPYFLYSGQHVTVDIPAVLAQCRQQFPQTELQLLPTLENDPSLEDVVVERLTTWVIGKDEGGRMKEESKSVHPSSFILHPFPTDGAAIEERSFQIIDQQLADWVSSDPGVRAIVRRVIHTTADISFARTLRIHPQAIERGLAALAGGKPIFCDVKMLQAGMTRAPGEVICLMDRAEVAARARAEGCTRAAAAMDILAPRLEGAIVAIGNAPTALTKLLELTRQGAPRPALVVGLPVGFVGAREAKQELLESDLCYITNVGPRGGSPVAAAVLNALAILQAGE